MGFRHSLLWVSTPYFRVSLSCLSHWLCLQVGIPHDHKMALAPTGVMCNLTLCCSKLLSQSSEWCSNESTWIRLLVMARECLPLIIMWVRVTDRPLGREKMLWLAYAEFGVNLIQNVWLLHSTHRVVPKGKLGFCELKEMTADPRAPRYPKAEAIFHVFPCAKMSHT